MSILNYGQKRKSIISIDDFESLLDKESYPISTGKSNKVNIDGEEIRYYCPIYHRAFLHNHICESCGLKGSYYALEHCVSSGSSYRLNLYGTDNDGIDVLFSRSRSKKPPRNGVQNMQLLCIRCIIKKDQEHGKTQKKARLEKTARYIDILAKLNIESFEQIREVKKETVFLFDGTPVKSSKVIAYCNNATHYGWINKGLMKKHRCIEKECPYMEKANQSYWLNLEVEKVKRDEARKRKKEVETQTRKRDEYIRSIFLPYDDIYVTSIREENGQLNISYIFDKFVDLSEPIKRIRTLYKLPVYLKAVRCSDINTQLLIRNRKRRDLIIIPGVGEATKKRLNDIGYYYVEDLVGRCPNEIYKQDCALNGNNVNRRMISYYSKAIEFASAH